MEHKLWVYIQDGKIKKGPVSLPNSWRNVSGFFRLGKSVDGVAALKPLGWLPVEKSEPSFDPELQYLAPAGFDIQADKVVWNFTVQDREIGEVFDTERFDAWYAYEMVDGGIILREAQAVYRTKQDVLSDLTLRPAQAKAYNPAIEVTISKLLERGDSISRYVYQMFT